MQRDIYQILVKNEDVSYVTEQWVRKSYEDLRIRRARTPKHSVVETSDAIFAANIVKWLQVAVKVNIIKKQ